tara:strand:+ start:60 stop:482 length:423 start_codon:yes stop_codon:yes gene_type:complete
MNKTIAQTALPISSQGTLNAARITAPPGTPVPGGYSNPKSESTNAHTRLAQVGTRNNQNLTTQANQIRAHKAIQDKALAANMSTDEYMYGQAEIAFRNNFLESRGLIPQDGMVAAMGMLNAAAQENLIRNTSAANQMNLA